MKKEDIRSYLMEKGIKPSYQRIKILEYLLEHRTHPTVDEIYKELVKEVPTLSKTTVYNTLNLFIEKNLATVITIEENETRYDADTSIHGHFKCEKCGKVYDFNVNISNLAYDGLENFQINDQHVYFKGICKDCLKNK
ncbi:Fur family transcriptional regulator [Caldisalinibacter kiritimatiensis]|uniref:Ferric uptake regulation protein n=1 Tax=Caldisalinibacter kiritimatiensis TaxID=1304284 RepID=R1CFJ5_9FIRM|nr:Fur family transcriptional regulator [Caldisalinibacter kiritimatiensis]EOD01070.1 Ferric uptake regulation protein [Caldisalinibacter kiritimatiensis]